MQFWVNFLLYFFLLIVIPSLARRFKITLNCWDLLSWQVNWIQCFLYFLSEKKNLHGSWVCNWMQNYLIFHWILKSAYLGAVTCRFYFVSLTHFSCVIISFVLWGDCLPEILWLFPLVPIGKFTTIQRNKHLFRTASTVVFEKSSSRFPIILIKLYILYQHVAPCIK